LWQSWRASSSEVAAQINDLLKDVKELETLATEYWTKGGSPEPEMKVLEVKIRGLVFVIAEFEAQADIVFGKHKRAYQEKVDALFVAATGGKFETTGREADFAQAITVKEASAALISVARKARQESAGLKAVYWLLRRSCFTTVRSLTWLLNCTTTVICFPFKWLSGRKMHPLF
jgi:hypothetical protein